MIKKPNITFSQLLFMAVGSSLMFPYTFMPILNTPPANQDVWIVLILSVVYIFILSFPIMVLINKFRGLNLNEMSELILGKVLGKAASLLFSVFFLFCHTACMLLGALFIAVAVLPGTPMWAIIILSYIAVAYVGYHGAGTIARLATFIVPFIMFTIVIFLLMGIDLMDFKVLKPILVDSTFLELNQGAFLTASRYSEILIFLVYTSFLMKRVSLNKTYISAVTVFQIFFAMILIPTMLVLGIDFGRNVFNPYFEYTGQVNAYDFIQRVQSLNAMAWFPGILLKLSIYNFMSTYTLSGIFNKKSYKSFVIPVTIISAIICMIPFLQKSSNIQILISDQVFPYFIIPFTFILPFCILMVYFIRRKKIDRILEEDREEGLRPESTSIQ